MPATALLLSASAIVHRTSWGHAFELHAFMFLQRLLPSFAGAELPVVVVDISGIPGGKDLPTPRGQLGDLIEAIAAQGPVAIAADIDFSPRGTGWVTAADPEFFDRCLAIRSRRDTPIFLGVYRTRHEAPEAWLGLPKYQGLAAAGLVKGHDTQRVPRWVPSTDPGHPLPSLSEVLARTYRAGQSSPAPWIAWALERHERSPVGGIAPEHDEASVLVNYSKLPQLRAEHIPLSHASSVGDTRRKLRGKLVMLGDVETPMDTFVVPGQPSPVPGVFVMAAAAYTLAVEPLFEFRPALRVVLDIAISLFIVFGVHRIKESSTKRTDKEVRRRIARFLWLTMLGVIFAGCLLVRFLSIMWLDFLLVVFALLLHPRVEEWMSGRLEALKATPDVPKS